MTTTRRRIVHGSPSQMIAPIPGVLVPAAYDRREAKREAKRAARHPCDAPGHERMACAYCYARATEW